MNHDIFFLIPLVLIGLVTSYEDIKTGKIRNRWIYLGLVWGLGVLLIMFVLNIFNPSWGISFKSGLDIFLNFISASLISFFIWKFNGWAAGDAKLFMVYALLVPSSFYQNSYLPIFPSFVLLVNIFFLVLLFIIVRQAVDFLGNIKFSGSGNNFFQKMKINFDKLMYGVVAMQGDGEKETFPFAIWMFAGVLLTLAVRMSIISLILAKLSFWLAF